MGKAAIPCGGSRVGTSEWLGALMHLRWESKVDLLGWPPRYV